MAKQIIILLILIINLISCSKSEKPIFIEPEKEILNIAAEYETLQTFNGKEFKQIIKTNTGGYIAIEKSRDYDVYKFDSDFNIIWNKQYGGSNDDYAESIIQTKDGGFLIIGMSKSSDGLVGSNYGGSDIWLCKIDALGNFIWGKNYGGSSNEGVSGVKSLIQTSDGGYMFIGHSESADGDVSQNHGGYDAWFVKTNSTGSIEFKNVYGGNKTDVGRSIYETEDHYTLLLKMSSSTNQFNSSGIWLLQINKNGEPNWQTHFEGINDGSLCTTSRDEIVIVNLGPIDFIISKVNKEGRVILEKKMKLPSSSKQPSIRNILKTSDNGYMLIGDLGNGNDQDAVVFRISSKFNLIYDKIYTGNSYDRSLSLTPVSNTQFIYQFITNSTDLDEINQPEKTSSVIIKLEEVPK